jgi:hypothetical protein
MHPNHSPEVVRAAQDDRDRALAQLQPQREALRHLRSRPPGPSRARLALARSLSSLADRLAAPEQRQPRRI